MKRHRRPTSASALRQPGEQGWGSISAIRAAKALLVVFIAVILSRSFPHATTSTNILCSSHFPLFCQSEDGYIGNFFSNVHSPSYGSRSAARYYPSLMNIQSEALRLLLDVTHENSGVALELVNLRIATSDLCAVVSASDLRDREVVYTTLRGVATDIQALGRRLTRSRAHIDGFADT